MLPPTGRAIDHSRLTFNIIRMPERDRVLLSLFYFEGLDLEAISSILSVPYEKIATSFYLAHAQLELCPSPEELLTAVA